MLKFVFVLTAAVALVLMPMQEVEAFKKVFIHTGPAPAAGADAGAALDPAALLQTIQTVIAGQLQEIQKVVGDLVQQKTALKQNALNSIQETLVGVKSQVQALLGQLRPPIVVRKHIYLGGAAPPPAPDATPAADDDDDDDDVTTTATE